MNEKLMAKIQREWKEHIAELMQLQPAEIIERAYENTWKEEIMIILKNKEFADDEIEAMLKCENLLDELYKSWLHTDGEYLEVLKCAIERRIKKLKQWNSI